MGNGGDRVVDRCQICEHDEQRADRQPALEDVKSADDQHERRPGERNGAHHDGEQRLLPRETEARTHRLVSRSREPRQLVPFACVAFDSGDRGQNLEGAFDECGLERFHSLGPVRHGGRIVAQAEIQERHDRKREQRERSVEVCEHGEHDAEVEQCHRQRKHTADGQVIDAVGIGVQAVDRIGRSRLNVVPQRECLQVLQQPGAQVVDDALAHLDLQLRVHHADRFGGNLHQQAREHDDDEQHGRSGAANRCHERRNRFRKRIVAENVVHDELERPRCQRRQCDLRDREASDRSDPHAIGPEKRQCPGSQRHVTLWTV